MSMKHEILKICLAPHTVRAKYDKDATAQKNELKSKELKSIDALKDRVLSSKKNQEKYETYHMVAYSIVKERGVSPDLIDRIALGITEKIPGFLVEKLIEIKKEAERDRKLGEIKCRWILIAQYARRCYEAAGYEWTPCRTALRIRIDNNQQELSRFSTP